MEVSGKNGFRHQNVFQFCIKDGISHILASKHIIYRATGQLTKRNVKFRGAAPDDEGNKKKKKQGGLGSAV
jgi:hypothetical protein